MRNVHISTFPPHHGDSRRPLKMLIRIIIKFVPVQPLGEFTWGVYTPHSSVTGGTEQILKFKTLSDFMEPVRTMDREKI